MTECAYCNTQYDTEDLHHDDPSQDDHWPEPKRAVLADWMVMDSRDFAALMVECKKCHNETDELAVFPGGVCLSCWSVSPEGRYLPTADELRRTWSGR